MKKTIKIEKDIDIAIAECQVFARYWEDSELNGAEDDADNPKMPCVENVDGELAWCPVINLDNGKILNWIDGETAKIHYKSCDENRVELIDRECGVVKEYEGYVPNILDPHREGCADYVIMEIDSNGYIVDFDNDIDDILNSED